MTGQRIGLVQPEAMASEKLADRRPVRARGALEGKEAFPAPPQGGPERMRESKMPFLS